MSYDKAEPTGNVTTWVYENDKFVPCAKIVNDTSYSIISDYIGRPIQALDESGNVVWDTEHDIYGKLRNLRGDRSFIPFRQPGQYEDVEIELYYNRYRYYSSDSGMYISQDPIGLAGNNPNFYAYVHDSNGWVDVFGLSGIGTWGEKVASKYLAKNGHRILGSVQNASGHGFDLVTKTASGDINIIEVKTSQSKWRSKSNMPRWTNNNISKISGNTNGIWGNITDYQKNLMDLIDDAKQNGKLKNKLLQVNIDKRSIRLKCK